MGSKKGKCKIMTIFSLDFLYQSFIAILMFIEIKNISLQQYKILLELKGDLSYEKFIWMLIGRLFFLHYITLSIIILYVAKSLVTENYAITIRNGKRWVGFILQYNIDQIRKLSYSSKMPFWWSKCRSKCS